MTKEIERKWLCHDWPNYCQLLETAIVEQFYVYVSDEIEVRIREWSNRFETNYLLTIKLGNGLCRTEIELKITEKEYKEILSTIPNARPIIKEFRTYLNGFEKIHVSRVDSEWMYAEIEFKSVLEAKEYKLPYDWEEVTDKAEYGMKNYWKNTRI